MVTNCITGEAEYKTEEKDGERLMRLCRASSSMPLLAPIVDIDGTPYLDGGVADSIPIRRAVSKGNDKIVVILTKNAGYRKKLPSKAIARLYRKAYASYPNLVRTALRRSQMYNRTMNELDVLERKGEIFVIRPQTVLVSRLERNHEKLRKFYEHGYRQMEREYENLRKYLDE